MGKKGFRDLKVWEESKNLAVDLYNITNSHKFSKDFGLKDQIRRSAISIPSNIAEGDERDTDKEAVRYFYISKGSLAELQTQIQIAYEIGYLEKDNYEEIENKCKKIGSMIGELIKFRQRTYSL